MRISKRTLGYNPERVRNYVSLLETEMMLLEKEDEKEEKAFLLTEKELLNSIRKLELRLTELQQLEKSLN